MRFRGRTDILSGCALQFLKKGNRKFYRLPDPVLDASYQEQIKLICCPGVSNKLGTTFTHFWVSPTSGGFHHLSPFGCRLSRQPAAGQRVLIETISFLPFLEKSFRRIPSERCAKLSGFTVGNRDGIIRMNLDIVCIWELPLIPLCVSMPRFFRYH